MVMAQNTIKRLRSYQKSVRISIIGFDATSYPYKYAVEIREEDNLNNLDKTYQQFKTLYCGLSEDVFELQKTFSDSAIKKQDPQVAQVQLNQFLKTLTARLDVLSNHTFRKFFELSMKVAELKVVQIESKLEIKDDDFEAVGMAWQQQDIGIFTTYVHKNKTAKIMGFFKTLLSKETRDGLIRFHKLEGASKWIKKWEIPVEGKPVDLFWSRKSSMLSVATNVESTFSRTIPSANQQHSDSYPQISYGAAIGITGLCYHPRTSTTYAHSSQIIYMHSLKTQLTYTPVTSLIGIGSIAIQTSENRLFASDKMALHVFDIEKDNLCVYMATIPCDTAFTKLLLGGKKNEYLFGLSQKGYITVFELKEKISEKQVVILTNVECPQNSWCMDFSFQHQLIFVEYRRNLYLINSKNLPICSFQNGKQRLRKIIYDAKKDTVITLGESITFNKLTLVQQEV